MSTATSTDDGRLTKSVTVEIVVHLVVLAAVLCPILMFIFPALLLAVGTVILTNVFAPGSIFAEWIAAAKLMPALVAFAAAAVAASCGIVWHELHRRDTYQTRLRLPSGRDGLALQDIVANQWRQQGGSTSAPAVRWFPSMDVAAYAAATPTGPELHVSAGLWRAIVTNQPSALAILAHEMAHLMFRDPSVLRWTARVGAAARAVMLATASVSCIVVAAVLWHETATAIRHGPSAAAISQVWVKVLAASAVVLVLLPLCWLALQRQTAFVTSLIEIRADVAAANWTAGLENFTQLFAQSEGVVRSTRGDLLSALLSPNFTHIPERERLQILRSPASVITPKLRFFAFSIVLVFLLPLNFATPLLFGGATNYLAMLSLAVSLNVAIVAMALVGRAGLASGTSIPAARCAMLALASCLIGALPRINLEPISYLAMSWLAGFGGSAMDWGQLPHDLTVTWHDVATRFANAFINPFAPVAAVIAFAAMRILSLRRDLSHTDSRGRSWILPAAIAGVGTCVAAIDPRQPMDPTGVLGAAIAEIGVHQSLLLCLPLGGAVVVDCAIMGIGRMRQRWTRGELQEQ